MIVYLATLLVVAYLCSIAEKQDRLIERKHEGVAIVHSKNAYKLYFLASCVLVLVAGLRYRVGTDYGAYYFGYEDYITKLFENLGTLHEPGFGIVAKASTLLINDGALVMLLASVITIGLPLVVIYRNTNELFLATVLLVIMGYWHGSFNGVRQYLAAAVLFCGYKLLQDREFRKYLIAVFVAFLFHRSAAIMALFYFVVYREVSFKNVVLLVVVIFVALRSYDVIFNLSNTLMDKAYSEDNAYTSTLVNRLRVLSSCVPAIIFMLEYRNVKFTKIQMFHMNTVIVHAAIRIVTMNSALLYRIGIYTDPFMAIAIPEMLKGIPIRNRRIYTFLIAIMYLLMWWYELSHGSSLSTFRWIWQR